MIKKSCMQLCWFSIASLLCLTAQAMPINEVIFEKGSNCGHYQGDLTSGKLFSLEMGAEEQLVISTDGHVQTVTDSKGQVLEDKGGTNYSYNAIHTGTHTIKMVGRVKSEIEFCVY